MRVSCVIRAHPKRADLVEDLLRRLDQPATVVWDNKRNSWDTGYRAWEVVDLSADWGLVIEDDALPCRDLTAGLERALAHVPAKSVVSAYLGNQTSDYEIMEAAERAGSARWLRAPTLVWGVAIAVPTATIPRMLSWCDRLHRYSGQVYDTRIARYYAEMLRWPAYYTLPSLVDHRQVPSLLRHVMGRHAISFIGDGSSALDVDWSGPVFDVHADQLRRIMRQQPRIFVATQSFAVQYGRHRVTVRKDITRVEEGHWLMEGREHYFKPLEAHFKVEQATAAPGEKRNTPGPFNPAEHSVAEVNAYLADADDAERERVLAAETDGKARATVLSGPHGV